MKFYSYYDINAKHNQTTKVTIFTLSLLRFTITGKIFEQHCYVSQIFTLFELLTFIFLETCLFEAKYRFFKSPVVAFDVTYPICLVMRVQHPFIVI